MRNNSKLLRLAPWRWTVRDLDREAYEDAWLEWSRNLNFKPTDTPDVFPSFEDWKRGARP